MISLKVTYIAVIVVLLNPIKCSEYVIVYLQQLFEMILIIKLCLIQRHSNTLFGYKKGFFFFSKCILHKTLKLQIYCLWYYAVSVDYFWSVFYRCYTFSVSTRGNFNFLHDKYNLFLGTVCLFDYHSTVFKKTPNITKRFSGIAIEQNILTFGTKNAAINPSFWQKFHFKLILWSFIFVHAFLFNVCIIMELSSGNFLLLNS